MAKITVSYRRSDSDAITGQIFDRLVAHYGADSIFRDIDNIPPGIDFRKHISGAIATTDILLAIVGPQWIGRTTDGNIRIQETTDLVRIEVEAALRKDIPVIPILVGHATMPQPTELPDGLKDFVFRNAVKIDALEDFDDHMKRLIRSLDRLLQSQQFSAQQETNLTVMPAVVSKELEEKLPARTRVTTNEERRTEITAKQHAPSTEGEKTKQPDGIKWDFGSILLPMGLLFITMLVLAWVFIWESR